MVKRFSCRPLWITPIFTAQRRGHERCPRSLRRPRRSSGGCRLQFPAAVGRSQRVRIRSRPGGSSRAIDRPTTPSLSVRHTYWPSTIAPRRTKPRRSSSGGRELKSAEEEGFHELLATRPTTEARAIACIEHVADCGLATSEMRAWLATIGIDAGGLNAPGSTKRKGAALAVLVCLLPSSLLLSWQLTAPTCEVIMPGPARDMVPRAPADLPRAHPGVRGFLNARERAALFAARVCEGGHGATRGCCALNKHRGWGIMSFQMSYHQRPHEPRLIISSEVEALVSDFGGEAYGEACRRAREASSNSLARDWNVVAATIVRRSGRCPSVLDALFG